MIRAWLSVTGVVALLSGGSVAVSSPTAVVPDVGVATVVGATLVCPDLRQAGDSVRTRVSAGVAAVGPTTGRGQLVARPLRGKGDPSELPVDRPGQVAVDLGAGVNGDALVVTARGALAGGLELEQVTRGTSGSERGLAGLRCQPPTTTTWFVGGSTKVTNATLLVLANTDDTPAVVDVSVWTGDGAVDPGPGRGLTVPPLSRIAVPLDELAPDRDLLALRVVSQRGRVAAAVRHARFDGRTPGGVDWVPQAQPPGQSVVVAGLPPGPGRRIVHVTNPGADPTVVSLQVTTARGQAVPPGLEAVDVPAATTVAVDLTRLTDPTAATVTVTSEGGPVLAGAFFHDSQGTSPVKEFAYGASAQPLRGPALLTDLVIDRPTESTLLLTALAEDAAIDVIPVPIVGIDGPSPAARRVEVPAGRVVAVPLSTFLPAGATGRLALEVRPVTGQVYAARYLRERGERGPLTTSLVLQGQAQQLPLPAVRRDPLVGVTR